jgi:hypothetical protein
MAGEKIPDNFCELRKIHFGWFSGVLLGMVLQLSE